MKKTMKRLFQKLMLCTPLLIAAGCENTKSMEHYSNGTDTIEALENLNGAELAFEIVSQLGLNTLANSIAGISLGICGIRFILAGAEDPREMTSIKKQFLYTIGALVCYYILKPLITSIVNLSL